MLEWLGKKVRKMLFNYTANLPVRLIGRHDENGVYVPYLERYHVGKIFGRTVYLHRFVASDADEEVHDHPWDSFSYIIVGAYLEERLTGMCSIDHWKSVDRMVYSCSINHIKSNDFHMIKQVIPETWTLFVHKPRIKGWGFLRKEVDKSTTYHQPYDVASSSKWWESAPTGKDSSRESFGWE